MKGTDFASNLDKVNTFWGYCLSETLEDNFKICKDDSQNNSDYGEAWMIGDRVGIMLDFTKTGLTISYFKNKESLGVAFENLHPGHYYPCVYLKFNESRISLLSKVDLPDI